MALSYISTRGGAPAIGFEDCVLAGLAPDGGLYMPEAWPVPPPELWHGLRGAAYPRLVAALLAPYAAGTAIAAELETLCDAAYAGFRHKAVAPLVQLDRNLWLLELFHGPTFAFKDFALQVLGRLLDAVLVRRGRRLTVLGATSGDTGSAAIAACQGSQSIDTVILFPAGRVSEIQRRQMTTVDAPNVHVAAVAGDFDAAQAIVKNLFGDAAFRSRAQLGAVNSINWLRIAAQSAYYAAAALALGATAERPARFIVPTGNFGNIFAGFAAAKMGLPVARLIAATNRNDAVARIITTGVMAPGTVEPSLSPSMDIQVPSNFERLMFEVSGRDGAALARRMTGIGARGDLRLDRAEHAAITARFGAYAVDDRATLATIATTYRETGQLVDPHTAVGLAVARTLRDADLDADGPVIALGCAHPAKFGAAVRQATGIDPPLPDALARLADRPERYAELPADASAVKAWIETRLAARHGGIGGYAA